MQHIVDLRNQPLTPELVCEIHRIVTEGTLKEPAAAGRLQDDDSKRVSVWGDGDQLLHRPPPVAELPARLDALCKFANERDSETYLPPVLRAIALHFMMRFDHYFEDGNGRTARAVFYWSMLNQGFWLTEFLTISRILRRAPAQYARSFLLTEQDNGDLTHFFIYHLGVIQRAIADLHVYLSQKAAAQRAAQVLAAQQGDLNTRQVALLGRAIKDPEVQFSARSHSMSHGVTNETARQDLLELERRGYLIRGRAGRQHVWTPAPDLEQQLARTT
nr:Fic family protein [Sanguibacter hominis]